MTGLFMQQQTDIKLNEIGRKSISTKFWIPAIIAAFHERGSMSTSTTLLHGLKDNTRPWYPAVSRPDTQGYHKLQRDAANVA